MKKLKFISVAVAAVFGLGCCLTGLAHAAATNTNQTVVRKPIMVRSITNFHVVTPGILRGAQPNDLALAQLKQFAGVKTVMNLRNETNQVAHEKQVVESNGMTYVSIPMNGTNTQDPGAIDAALAILTAPSQQPVFVHCQYGKDRTGLVLAAYRVKYEHWLLDDAIQEMLLYGYDRGCCSNLESSLKLWAARPSN